MCAVGVQFKAKPLLSLDLTPARHIPISALRGKSRWFRVLTSNNAPSDAPYPSGHIPTTAMYAVGAAFKVKTRPLPLLHAGDGGSRRAVGRG